MRRVEGGSGELFPCGGSILEEMLFFGSCFFCPLCHFSFCCPDICSCYCGCRCKNHAKGRTKCNQSFFHKYLFLKKNCQLTVLFVLFLIFCLFIRQLFEYPMFENKHLHNTGFTAYSTESFRKMFFVLLILRFLPSPFPVFP